MRWSKTFIPTLREAPADAAGEGRRWLARAGFLRERAGSGRVWLFLGQRSLARIEAIATAELEQAGGEPMRAESARDLAMAAQELRSYRQLPRLWFASSGTAVRGIAVGTQTIPIAAIAEKWGVAYDRAPAGDGEEIVARCGGDRELLACENCGSVSIADFAASEATAPGAADPDGDRNPEAFHTPGQKTIADVAAFTGLPETTQMKSVVMVADGKPVLALVRGDHQLSEAKLLRALAAAEARPARAEEILEAFGAQAGSLGPIGARARVVMDSALRGRRNMICGANRDDYHLRHVTPGEDFDAEVADIRKANAGERCSACGGKLAATRRMSLATVAPVGGSAVRVTDAEGRESAPSVVEFALYLENVLLAAAEIYRDKDGMILPKQIAPVDVVVTPVSADFEQMRVAKLIAEGCERAGLDALLDDRDERPGVKFKDSDLIGAPYRVTVGKKLPQGLVEVVARQGRATEDVAVDMVSMVLRERL